MSSSAGDNSSPACYDEWSGLSANNINVNLHHKQMVDTQHPMDIGSGGSVHDGVWWRWLG